MRVRWQLEPGMDLQAVAGLPNQRRLLVPDHWRGVVRRSVVALAGEASTGTIETPTCGMPAVDRK